MMTTPPPATVDDALEAYLDEIKKSRAQSTHRTYTYIVGKFRQTLQQHDCLPTETSLAAMNNEWLHWFLDDLRHLSPTTERGYLPAILGFYDYVVAKNWLELNLTELRYYLKRRRRKLPHRVQTFPRQQIEALLTLLDHQASGPFDNDRLMLGTLRDRALFYTLADTGLRISEACSRRRGHLDWAEGLLFVTGKGDKEALVRISSRALSRLKTYLERRQSLDGQQGVKHLATLPLFARHDKRVGDRILPLSSRAVQKNLVAWSQQLWDPDGDLYEITPHTFRHYFVTTVLRKTGGDIEIAKRLARHADISTTMRYAHLSDDELDRAYDEIFNE